MKTNLNPGFFSIDLPWKTILDQEGLHWEIIKNNINKNACIIITDDTKISLNILEKYIKLGGLILISSFQWKSITKSKNHKIDSSFLVPENKSYFSSLDFVEVNHVIEYPKNKLMKPIDNNLCIYQYQLGSGCVIIHPFNLKKIYNNTKSMRKKFYDFKKELPSEVVSSTSKSKIRKTLFLCLKYLYNFKNFPLIRSSYNPKNYSSIFCFRVDSDFSNEKNALKINNLCDKYSIPATWFIETSSNKMIKNVYKNFKNIEFAFHGDKHIVFKDFINNKKNIVRGLDKLKNLKINNISGFAGPFGDWNKSLNSAIENDFLYSSEFSYDYDNFPSYPIIGDVFSQIMQLPVHPISIGRLNRSHYSEKDMKNYYSRIIKNKYLNREPILIYYHPNNRFLSVIENIFKEIQMLNIKIMTMYEYYHFWLNRINNKPNCSFNNNTIFISNSHCDIEILLNNNFSILESKKELQLSNISFQKINFCENPKDIKKINKKSWRNLLYDFERYNTMRKM